MEKALTSDPRGLYACVCLCECESLLTLIFHISTVSRVYGDVFKFSSLWLIDSNDESIYASLIKLY